MTNVRTEIDAALGQGIRYFASGSNHPGEIAGLADAGIDVGVAVHELHSGGIHAIECAVREHGVRVFVDSGAFSEIGFGPTGPFVAEEISEDEWGSRLATYVEIADRIGSALFCVAPDMVAFQAQTLDRMTRWAHMVRAVARRGANLLVPCQKGALSLAEFWQVATAVLGIPAAQLVAAIPMKKDATSTPELAAFVREAQPARVHLLGLGPKSARFDEVIAAVRAASPATEIFCDSVLITSLVGRSNGKGGAPRPLTAATDTVVAELEERLFSDCGDLDYTDAIACPSEWLTVAGLKRLARDLAALGVDSDGLVADVDGWLQQDDNYLDPRVDLALDGLWAEYARGAGTTTYRKREALRRLFGGVEVAEGAGGQLGFVF
jgi:hypothetical protein